MKKISIIITTTLCCLFVSCSEKEREVKKQVEKIGVPEYVKMNKNTKLTDSLLDLAINNGDIKAYSSVASNYILDANYEDLFYSSIIMANRYNSSEAHFHIFLILSNSNNGKPFDQLDNKTKNLALYHLIKSNELGYESAKYSINEVLGKGNILKDSKYYLNEYSK